MHKFSAISKETLSIMESQYNNSDAVENTCCYCVHLKLGVIFMAVVACLDCIFRLVVLCLSLYDSIDKNWENYTRSCEYQQDDAILCDGIVH